jgi:hypothetical protein
MMQSQSFAVMYGIAEMLDPVSEIDIDAFGKLEKSRMVTVP